jgi:hypothetical protein
MSLFGSVARVGDVLIGRMPGARKHNRRLWEVVARARCSSCCLSFPP